MATATSETRIIPETVETTVALSLTEEEARVLYDLCFYVGGDPEAGRGKVDAIRRALQEATGWESGTRHRYKKDGGITLFNSEGE